MAILDWFLQNFATKIGRKQLQLVDVAVMFIASTFDHMEEEKKLYWNVEFYPCSLTTYTFDAISETVKNWQIYCWQPSKAPVSSKLMAVR